MSYRMYRSGIFVWAVLSLNSGCTSARNMTGDESGNILAVDQEFWVCPEGSLLRLDESILVQIESGQINGLENLVEAFEPVSEPCTAPIERGGISEHRAPGSSNSLALVVDEAQVVNGVKIVRRLSSNVGPAWEVLVNFLGKGKTAGVVPETQKSSNLMRRLMGASAKSRQNPNLSLGQRIKIAASKFVAGVSGDIQLPSGFKFNPSKYVIDKATDDKIINWLSTNTSLLTDSTSFQRALSAGAQAGLSKSETAAIYYYSKQGFLDFANVLNRGGTRYGIGGTLLDDAMIENMFRAASSGLNKLKPYQGPAYFGAALPEKQTLAMLKPNQIFRQRNFTSTSVDVKMARSYAARGPQGAQLDEGQASFLFYVENGKNGKSIGPFTEYPFEQEVLFPANHPFTVKKITPLPHEGGSPMYDVLLGE